MNLYQTCFSFFIYSLLGWCTEVAYAAFREKKFVNRGFLNGPFCPIYGFGVICITHLLADFKDNLLVLFFMSVVVATLLELVTGMLLEKLFHHRWWDYSDMPGNIRGHICPLFSLAWGLGCVVIVRLIHPPILKFMNWLPHLVGLMIVWTLVVFGSIDLCVTVNGILKMNLNLKKMQEIAEELRQLSDRMGENISKNVIQSIEKQEQLKVRIAETKEKYQELYENTSFTHRRLLNAFPGMESIHYKKQLQELKEFLQKNRLKKRK